MAQPDSAHKERQIIRLECPIHGADTGIVSMVQGVTYCQHCRIPASKLVEVRYVPADLVVAAVFDALSCMDPETAKRWRADASYKRLAEALRP